MRCSVVLKVLSCVLAVLFPASTMLADSHAAMLYVRGVAALNGVSAPSTGAVFAGDRIQTGTDAAAVLTLTGSTVNIAPSSSLVYEDNALELNSGAALVSTQKGLPTRIGKLVVTPAQPNGRFQVTRADGKVLIAAHSGAVNVFDGTSTSLVMAGMTSTLADPDPQGGAKPAAGTPLGGLAGLGHLKSFALAFGAAGGLSFLVYELVKGEENAVPPVTAATP